MIRNYHSVDQGPSAASDGRDFKKRLKGNYGDVMEQVLDTKLASPVPGDIMKTAATKKNVTLRYAQAHRLLSAQVSHDRDSFVKNFQLIGPYLTMMAHLNPASVMGSSRKNQLMRSSIFISSQVSSTKF